MKTHKYLSIANRLIKKNKLLDAERTLKKGLEANPKLYLYYTELGDICTKLKKISEAERYYNKALALNPKATWIFQKIKMLGKFTPTEFVGIYDIYPDHTGKRQLEGGRRLTGENRNSKPGEPLVSIITVVFNNEDTLQNCIDSVKKQHYPNVEYIIVDGGSNQKTLDIIKKNEDFIDYFFSEPDDGIYAAMNKGIKVAKGDYVCLLNSDDVYEAEFVKLAVEQALQDPLVDIIYTDYFVGKKHLVAQPLSEGILFGHLHVCHNTFLTSKKAYNRVGAYDEEFRIVSDAVWMRQAFLKGLNFKCINKPLFTLSEGGLSSGGTEAHRRLFIDEVISSYKMSFAELSTADAEAIYLFRFNKQRTDELAKIVENYRNNKELLSALRFYVEHCFKDRANFRLSRNESETLFPKYIALSDKLKININAIQLETKQGSLQSILNRADDIVSKRKSSPKKVILHFISVFSAPPETFVYDLLNRLEADGTDNFVLYEHEQLGKERPFEKKIHIYWNDFPEIVGKQIYKYIVEKVRPDVIIGHFALNEWKWSQRVNGLGIEIPTISMCHGIDVFSLKDNEEYRDYILNNFSKRKNTAFTAVSDYLYDELKSAGIPTNKIHKVHNTVNPIFFEHRKTKNFYDYQRKLKLLSVGRLIPLKGHEYLIRALAEFKSKATADFELTIVYGGGDELLKRLEDLVDDKDLGNNVTFEKFVNFKENPSYFAQFDLFLHPSTYDGGIRKRSEAFGVAVLEAISAGLPVISTNAGGLPEVLGTTATPHAKLVNHADSNSIAAGLIEAWNNKNTFTDNLEYAKERLDAFSASKQIAKINSVIARVTNKNIKAALFSTSTIQGAGYAAYRLHRGLRDTNIKSHLFTTVRNHEDQPDVTVLKHPSGDNRQWNAFQLKPKDGLTIFTINHPHIDSKDLVKMVEPYDIINLHWHARFLSIENIATLTHLNKPVVITIRDMMPITGGCHCFHSCQKWQNSCAECPQINSKYTNYPMHIQQSKRESYNFKNITLVVLSNTTKKIVSKAPFFRDCRIEVIHNSIETNIFKPYDKKEARIKFGLPLDKKIIGYVPSFSSEAKGYRELVEALEIINKTDRLDAPFILLVGNPTPATDDIKQEKKYLGYIADNTLLAEAYSACDVVAVPSLEETFSNTTAEAISCGVPVVGFRTGAIPDLVLPSISGVVCDVGNSQQFAEGIISILKGPNLQNECRAVGEEKLSFELQASQYEKLFNELTLNLQSDRLSRFSPATYFELFKKPTLVMHKIISEKLIEAK